MKHLIIGNGAAGITAAKTLREKSPESEIIVLTDEKYHYYNRPALIDFIAGRKKEEELYFYPADWYDKNKIKVILQKSAEKIDTSTKSVKTDDGEVFLYNKLLIASGASSNIPPIPGCSNNSDVLTLRCLDDAKNFINRAAKSSQIAFIGGGVLGLEAACAIKSRFPNLEITIIEVAPWLLPRQLDKEGAAVLETQLKKLGIKRIIVGAKIISVEKTNYRLNINLETTNGNETIISDIAMVSAGIKPNIEIASSSGISVGKGIVVNELLQTSNPDIYAAGDAAEFNKTIWGIIPAAIEQGRIAATNMVTTQTISYKGTIMSNTLKVAGLELTTEGDITKKADNIYEVSVSDGKNGIYKKIFVKKENNTLAGFICMGDKFTAQKLSRILKSSQLLSPDDVKNLLSNQ